MAANSLSPALLPRPIHHQAPAPSGRDDLHYVARQAVPRSWSLGRKPGTVSPPGSAPPHKDKFAAKLWWHQTGPAPLSNQGSNHEPRLRPPRPIPIDGKRSGRLDRDNAHTGFETLLYFRSLPLRAAARLSHGLPIKALDPVGTSFLLLITTNR